MGFHIVDEHVRDARAHVGIAVGKRQHRACQINLNGVLQYVAARAKLEGFAHVGVIRIHAQDQDLDLGKRFQNFLRRLHPAKLRHREVHHYHVGLEFLGELDGREARRSFADHLDAAGVLEDAAKTLTHKRVVFRQNDADFFLGGCRHSHRLLRLVAAACASPQFGL